LANRSVNHRHARCSIRSRTLLNPSSLTRRRRLSARAGSR
jgi:hypothetical protein